MKNKNAEVPEGYKKTEIGIIPEEWEIIQIDQLVEINKESKDPAKNSEQIFYYIDIDAVENGTGLIKNPKLLLGKEAPSRARRVIHTNDVIMSTVRPYHKAFALVPHRYDNQICSTGFAVFTCKKELDPKFLLQSLFSDKVIDQCISMMVGGQYPALNTTQVSKIRITVPSLSEQQKIASILSKVDEQIEQTEQIIEKIELLKKGLMQKLLTKGIGHTKFKKTELGEIPEEWKVIGISKCCSEIFLGLTSKVDYVENGGIPLIRASDISKGYLSFEESRFISKEQHDKLTKYRCARKGDVLISKSGSLGVCAIVNTDKTFSIYESIIDLQPIHEIAASEFLLWLMRDSNTQKRLLGNKVGSTVGHLNLIQFRSLKIVLPSLKEQQKIASILSKVDSQIKDNQNYLTKLQELKKGLMQDLLTGKVRVCV